MITVWKEENRPLLIPKDFIDGLKGNKNRKICVVCTKSEEVIVTRMADKYPLFKAMVHTGKNDDWVPTAILKSAHMDKLKEFKIKMRDGDIIVSGVKLEFSEENSVVRNLDI